MPVPGSPEWHARVEMLLAEEAKQPLVWWYLSFAGPDKFNGGVIVKARGFTSALQATHRMGINPGGQVASMEIGPELPPHVPASMCNRLLAKEELERWDEASGVPAEKP